MRKLLYDHSDPLEGARHPGRQLANRFLNASFELLATELRSRCVSFGIQLPRETKVLDLTPISQQLIEQGQGEMGLGQLRVSTQSRPKRVIGLWKSSQLKERYSAGSVDSRVRGIGLRDRLVARQSADWITYVEQDIAAQQSGVIAA